MGSVSSVTLSIDEKVRALKQPEVYPFPVTQIDTRETHMSWVFLTEEFAYKIKKPFRNSYQDLSTIDLRFNHLQTEYQVNQALAKNIYLALVPLLMDDSGNLYLGQGFRPGEGFSNIQRQRGEIVDWLLQMKKAPENEMLDFALKNKQFDEQQLRETAKYLVGFYIKTPPEYVEAPMFWNKLLGETVQTHAGLQRPEFNFDQERIAKVANNLFQFLHEEMVIFEKRVLDARILEAHGDLRPEHIKLAPSPLIIDRLEFSRELRIMDVAEELAFLGMECEYLGNEQAGKVFQDVYLEKTGDRIPQNLIHFYKSKRAFLRCFLVVRHVLEPRYQKDPKWFKKANHYLMLAEKYGAMF